MVFTFKGGRGLVTDAVVCYFIKLHLTIEKQDSLS